jgi:hypothetical protein
MNRRRTLALSATAALAVFAASSGAVQAGGPVQTRDSYIETFHDDFIFDLCGINTFTTVTEHWTFKEFPDGSATFHGTRTFVSDDPRLPIEKGAATSFIAPDGSRRVVGKPIQLIGPNGGVRILDAGWIELDPDDNPLAMRGPHPFFNAADLAPYYCP